MRETCKQAETWVLPLGGMGPLCLTKGCDYNTRLGYMCTTILDLVISTLTHAQCTFPPSQRREAPFRA